MVEKNITEAASLCEWRDSVDFTGRLLKNFSYEENYHDKYYIPQLIHENIKERRLGICTVDCVDEHVGTLCDTVPSEVSTQVVPTCSPRAWFLSPSPDCLGASLGANAGINTSSLPSSAMTDGNPLLGDMAFSPGATEPGNSDMPENSAISALQSSASITSEDSVFSDDYSLTYDQEDLGGSGPRADDGSDADSSFSSSRSSTSTLEGTDTIQHGGIMKDAQSKVKQPKHDKSPRTQQKHRPDIHLVIPSPQTEEAKDFSEDTCSPLGEESEGACSMGDKDSGGGDSSTEGAGPEPFAAECNTGGMSSSYEDREFDFLKAEPVRRSTSLKTYKTPPGTPHRKKGVRFADALGLDLESVRHILNLDEPPVVPKSAMEHLRVGLEKEHPTAGVKYLSALFSQPGADPAFVKRVLAGKVALENCVVNDKDMALSGLIRVANISFHKTVLMRYTTNGWMTSDDVSASYVQNSNDGPTDRFSFTLTVPKYFAVGQRLEFAVMFSSNGNTYWDNNFDKNYVVECYARAAPTCESDNTWMHFL